MRMTANECILKATRFFARTSRGGPQFDWRLSIGLVCGDGKLGGKDDLRLKQHCLREDRHCNILKGLGRGAAA